MSDPNPDNELRYRSETQTRIALKTDKETHIATIVCLFHPLPIDPSCHSLIPSLSIVLSIHRKVKPRPTYNRNNPPETCITTSSDSPKRPTRRRTNNNKTQAVPSYHQSVTDPNRQDALHPTPNTKLLDSNEAVKEYRHTPGQPRLR